MNIDRGVRQQPALALDKTQQLCFTWYLPCYSAQVHRTALVNSNQQPGKISNACFSFHRLQLSNFHKPSMIEIVDRHGILLFFVRAKLRSTFIVPINPLFLKVYGR
jgi:hypothetical protein